MVPASTFAATLYAARNLKLPVCWNVSLAIVRSRPSFFCRRRASMSVVGRKNCRSRIRQSYNSAPMRLDSHQHFWSYSEAEYDWIDERMTRIRRDFSPQDLEPILRQNGFDGSIAVQVRQSLDETEYLLGLADRHDFIKGVVGWVDLRSPQARRDLERLSEDKSEEHTY